MTKLLELAELCEKAEKGSRGLDAAIYIALHGHDKDALKGIARGTMFNYTTSLDAAETVVPDGHVFTVSDWYNGDDERLPHFADCAPRDGDEYGDVQQSWANSKRLALCAAGLRAQHAAKNNRTA